jgi:glyoxylase-like metal-dependent hydrolase (beta-lactamase superfamily II)
VDTGGPNLQVPLLKALRTRGVTQDDVTHVLITHCHWDHIGNVTLFRNARFAVAGRELRWARKQSPGTWQVADLHVGWMVQQRGRVDEVDDGDEVVPGVVVVSTPGHTPGHCAYRVAADSSHRLFSGDAIKNRAELITGAAAMTLDEMASRTSIERLRHELVVDPACTLVPGHDAQLRLDDGRLVLNGQPRAEITAMLGSEGAPVTFDLGTAPEDG